MVRSDGGGCFWSLGGGCGTNASKPLEITGVITMKMISSTSNTSISGVTFIAALGPLLEPTTILIIDLLYLLLRAIAHPLASMEPAAGSGLRASFAARSKGLVGPHQRRAHCRRLRLPSRISPACRT